MVPALTMVPLSNSSTVKHTALRLHRKLCSHCTVVRPWPAAWTVRPCHTGFSTLAGMQRRTKCSTRGLPSNKDEVPGEPAASSSAPTTQPPHLLTRVFRFIDTQILPVALISMMLVGFSFPAWGRAAAAMGLNKGITIAIFIIAGLQLKRGEALAALKAWGCVAWGLASILLFTPVLGPALLALPIPQEYTPLALGTAVFCCMPTTLSSGISMTTAAGGNTALAILLTISSNILGVLTLPLILPALLGPSVGCALKPLSLLLQLCETVLLPTVLGASLRAFVPGVAAAVDGNRRVVIWASAACLATVPWMQVSKAASAGLVVPVHQLMFAGCLGIAVHLAFLVLNWVSVHVLSLGGDQPHMRAQLRQALVLQASQKTLPVAVAVLSEGPLAVQLGLVGSGLAAISAVAAHLGQVLIDSSLISSWTAYIRQAKEQQVSSAQARPDDAMGPAAA